MIPEMTHRLVSNDGKLNYVTKKQDNSPTGIDSDITQIGWNEDYIYIIG